LNTLTGSTLTSLTGSLPRGPLEASSIEVAMTITAVAMATTIRAVQVRWAA
jgi:hypothetical protein